MSGDLQAGQSALVKGVIDSVQDATRGICTVVCPERYGPDPLRNVPWLPTPGIEPVPHPQDPVWLIEYPGGALYWFAFAPDKACSSEHAVMWAPLRTILAAVLDMLDDLTTHTHQAGTLLIAPVGGGSCTGTSGGPVETLGYGDARSDTEDDKPKAPRTRLVTKVPRGTDGEEA